MTSIARIRRPAYPSTRKVDQVDQYHGIEVRDPYRWLEYDADPDRLAWMVAQNDMTAEYLAQIPVRLELRRRFDQLLRYPRCYQFSRRGPYLLFTKNDGLKDQLVLCVQEGLEAKPETLVDPNDLASDGTLRVTTVALSKNARYLAYGLSNCGTEWEEYAILDMDTRQNLSDRLQSVKASLVAWHGNGFYYSRYPRWSSTQLSARNDNHQVWYHRVGTSQEADELTYEDQEHPLRLYLAQTTEDERFVILSVFDRGAEHAGHALWLRDGGASRSEFIPIVSSFDHEFAVIDNEDDSLLVLTNCNAPNRRLIRLDPGKPHERYWEDVIPERNQPLEVVSAVGGKLLAIYRGDGSHRLYVFDQAGRLENEIPLPGNGLVQVFPGQRLDRDAFWGFTSFTVPLSVYRYDIAARTSSIFHKPDLPFRTDDYETEHVFYPSKDGTSIPMFVVHRKGLALNGRHPLLLQGYGGNGFSIGPSFDPLLIALLERGVVFAVAGLRGGGEYGEAWHQAGWRDKKQNVFDDCIAAAEWLQAHGYSSADKSALIGTSNGGLLVGAVMVQRPDLFKVALPGAGIMDMLRFQHFTLGWAWVAEYGSSDDPAMFPILQAYSPLHNIQPGTSYPATLVTTYEKDDCVVPAHSFKFAATLQELGAGPNPYLIRIEMRSGHGAVSLRKELEERADLYAFLLAHLAGRSDSEPTGQSAGAQPRACHVRSSAP